MCKKRLDGVNDTLPLIVKIISHLKELKHNLSNIGYEEILCEINAASVHYCKLFRYKERITMKRSSFQLYSQIVTLSVDLVKHRSILNFLSYEPAN